MKKKLFIGQYRLCDLITMCSTLSAIIGIILCFNNHTNIPFLLLVACCLCDSFDGFVARRRKNTEFETSYGVELDSLSDMTAFGVFPAVMALTTVKYKLIMYILPFYVLAGLVRLTYFNALNINKKAEKGYFRGVPITTISLIYPFMYFVKISSIEVYSVITICLFALLAVLFVANIKVKKPNLEKILSSCKKNKKKTNPVVDYLLFPIFILLISDLFYKVNGFRGFAIFDMFKSIFNYPLAFLLLLIIISLINLLFTGIFKSVRKAHFTLLIIVSILLLINDLKYIIMLNPVSLSDIHFLNTSNIGTAGLYLKTVNGTWVIKTVIKFIVMILISVFTLKFKEKDTIKNLTKRLLFFFIPIILIPTFFIVSSKHSLSMVKKFYGYNYDMVIETTDYGIVYYNMGLYQGIIFNHYALNVHEPDNYDKDEVISILNEYKYKLPDQNFGKPNIVIILSEAFSDITNLSDITFDKDILHNIHELDKKSNVIVANTKVSTFGGASVISEWEMLTSSSNNFNPAGYIAYTEYYKDKYKDYIKSSPSIIKTLNKEGYTTKYITPWSNESYNSGIVYKTLGIDETKYNIEGIKKGFYLADSEINKSILNELNTDPNTPKLLIYATAENHMPCSLDKFESYDINVTNSKLDKENTDLIKCYAQGVYDADSALGNLYNDIQNIDKDTIVIFFGDHLPFITNNKGDNSYLLSRYFKTSDEDLNDLRKYTTKGVIFSNYIENLDKSIDYVNLNYLSAYVYSNLDIKNNEYFKFVNDMRKIVPVFSKTYILDDNKLIKQKNISKDQKEALEKLRNVQFYSFYDNN